MMARLWCGWVLLVGLLWGAQAQAQLKVVATLPDLAAIAREVGGERVEVEALVRPTEDAHYIDARPSLVVVLHKADLLISNGMELEVGWLPPLQVQARNPKIQIGAAGFLDASTAITPMEVPAVVDRSQGDIHPQGNPHYTIDPRAGLKVAEAVAARLGQLDPGGAGYYKDRLTKFREELSAFARDEAARFAAIPAERRRVVTFHRSLVYLLDWLQLRRDVNVQPRPGIQPTPSHTAQVLQTIRATGVRAILQEEFYPRKTSQTLAELGKVKLVILPGGTRFSEGQRYIDYLRQITGAVYESL